MQRRINMQGEYGYQKTTYYPTLKKKVSAHINDKLLNKQEPNILQAPDINIEISPSDCSTKDIILPLWTYPPNTLSSLYDIIEKDERNDKVLHSSNTVIEEQLLNIINTYKLDNDTNDNKCSISSKNFDNTKSPITQYTNKHSYNNIHNNDKDIEEIELKKKDEITSTIKKNNDIDTKKYNEEILKERQNSLNKYYNNILQKLLKEREKLQSSRHDKVVLQYSNTILSSLSPEKKNIVETFLSTSMIPLDDDLFTIHKIIALANSTNFIIQKMFDIYYTYTSLDECISRQNIDIPIPPDLKHYSKYFIVSFHLPNNITCLRCLPLEGTLYDAFLAIFLILPQPKTIYFTCRNESYYFIHEAILFKDTNIYPSNDPIVVEVHLKDN